MDNDMKDLQSLWQQQKSKPIDTHRIIKELDEMEIKNKRDRMIILFMFPVTILFLIFVVPILENPYFMAGIIIFALAMLMIMFLVFRNKFEKANNHQEITNKDFIHTQIKKLKDKMKITSVYMWLYSFLIILGVNVCYIGAFDSVELWIRVVIHFGVSIPLFVFMYWTINKKKAQNKKEIEPLIEQLEELKVESL